MSELGKEKWRFDMACSKVDFSAQNSLDTFDRRVDLEAHAKDPGIAAGRGRVLTREVPGSRVVLVNLNAVAEQRIDQEIIIVDQHS
jgi:hypothetical protein